MLVSSLVVESAKYVTDDIFAAVVDEFDIGICVVVSVCFNVLWVID